jgi:low affinity Fe/Cu permease
MITDVRDVKVTLKNNINKKKEENNEEIGISEGQTNENQGEIN